MDKENIDILISKVDEIEILIKSFIADVKVRYSPSSGGGVIMVGFSDYHWDEPEGKILETQLKLIENYEEWYSQAGQVISDILPERRPDFIGLYEKNKNIIELKEEIWSQDKSKFENDFLRNLGKQKSILSSTINMLNTEKTGKQSPSSRSSLQANSTTQRSNGLDLNMYIDLKSQMTILSQQYSRIEADIKDVTQKIDGIGRVTINNLNQNTAKTGNISISNENLVKWVKPNLDKELINLKAQIADTNASETDKKALEDIIELILKEENPKLEWLKDKVSKLKYWGTNAGLAFDKIREFIDALGVMD